MLLKTNNIRDEPPIINYIISTPATLLPVFNILEKQFKEGVQDPKYLTQLFGMYTGKSIKFMKQVQTQFKNDAIYDYIERHILTRHPYIKDIIGKCIQHAADIKLAIFKKDRFSDDDVNLLISKYSVCLMYLSNDENKSTELPIEEYFKNELSAFISKVNNEAIIDKTTIDDISDNIITQIPSQHKSTYKSDLANVLSVSTETKTEPTPAPAKKIC